MTNERLSSNFMTVVYDRSKMGSEKFDEKRLEYQQAVFSDDNQSGVTILAVGKRIFECRYEESDGILNYRSECGYDVEIPYHHNSNFNYCPFCGGQIEWV